MNVITLCRGSCSHLESYWSSSPEMRQDWCSMLSVWTDLAAALCKTKFLSKFLPVQKCRERHSIIQDLKFFLTKSGGSSLPTIPDATFQGHTFSRGATPHGKVPLVNQPDTSPPVVHTPPQLPLTISPT